MVKKLVLFDVDKTLLNMKIKYPDGHINKYKRILNRDVKRSEENFEGYTYLWIILKTLEDEGIKKDPETIQKLFDARLEDINISDLSESKLMEGVLSLLEELHKDKNIIIGISTGNTKDVTYAKLKHFNIDRYFLVGGFGDKYTERSDVVKEAVREAENIYGHIDKKDIYIIGDTKHDILSAKKAGVKSIAVASGYFSVEELKKENPDYIFKDLKNTSNILKVIRNG
jgi:phosphoglycolate phosphatase-like HAD superfamily hydrolase